MIQIQPINQEQCKPHYGKEVLVMLKDGEHLAGILSRCGNEKLFLNEETANGTMNSVTAKRTAKGKKKTGAAKRKTNVQSKKEVSNSNQTPHLFGPVPEGLFQEPHPLFNAPGRGITLDLSFIDMMFVLS